MVPTIQQLLHDFGPGGVLSAVQVLPKRVRFEGQGHAEQVLLLLRPHWATNLWWMCSGILLAFVPVVWPFFPVVSALPERFLLAATFLWSAFVLAFVFEEFLTWFFSVSIITDERIIDIDFYGLLFKHVSIASFSKIQDVNYVQKGMVGTMFNFGDILIQTASEAQTIDCAKVPHPDRIVKVLSELTSKREQEVPEANAS